MEGISVLLVCVVLMAIVLAVTAIYEHLFQKAGAKVAGLFMYILTFGLFFYFVYQGSHLN